MANIYERLRGTLENAFRFGLARPQIRSTVTGELETRDAADAAYANHRGADPVVDDDLATKRYVDTLVTSEGVTLMRIPVGLVNVSSATSTPVGARIIQTAVKIVTPYSALATITVSTGITILNDTVSGDNDPQNAGTYSNVDQDAGPTAAAPIDVTIGGAPAVGSAVVWLLFAVPVS